MPQRVPKKADTDDLEERLATLEGILQGLAVITIVYTPSGQLVRVTATHARTVQEVRAARRALQVTAMQMEESLVEAARQEERDAVVGLSAHPPQGAPSPEGTPPSTEPPE